MNRRGFFASLAGMVTLPAVAAVAQAAPASAAGVSARGAILSPGLAGRLNAIFEAERLSFGTSFAAEDAAAAANAVSVSTGGATPGIGRALMGDCLDRGQLGFQGFKQVGPRFAAARRVQPKVFDHRLAVRGPAQQGDQKGAHQTMGDDLALSDLDQGRVFVLDVVEEPGRQGFVVSHSVSPVGLEAGDSSTSRPGEEGDPPSPAQGSGFGGSPCDGSVDVSVVELLHRHYDRLVAAGYDLAPDFKQWVCGLPSDKLAALLSHATAYPSQFSDTQAVPS